MARVGVRGLRRGCRGHGTVHTTHPCTGAPAAVEVTGPTTTCRWRFNTFADTAVAFGVAEGARPECEANHFRGARVAAIHCQTGGGGTFTRNCISEAEVGVHTQSRADPTFVHNLLFDCSGPARTRTACAVRVDAAGAGRFLRNALWDNAHAAAIVATDGAPRLRDNSVLLSTKPRGTNVDAQGAAGAHVALVRVVEYGDESCKRYRRPLAQFRDSICICNPPSNPPSLPCGPSQLVTALMFALCYVPECGLGDALWLCWCSTLCFLALL